MKFLNQNVEDPHWTHLILLDISPKVLLQLKRSRIQQENVHIVPENGKQMENVYAGSHVIFAKYMK